MANTVIPAAQNATTLHVLWSKYAAGWGFGSAICVAALAFFLSDGGPGDNDGGLLIIVLAGAVIVGFAYSAVMLLVGWLCLAFTTSLWLLGTAALSVAILPLLIGNEWRIADQNVLIFLAVAMVPTVGAFSMFSRSLTSQRRPTAT